MSEVAYAVEKIRRHHAKLNFDASIPPVIEIDPGDSVVVETDYGAPEVVVTGPILVRGARPGDALAVRVQRIVVLDALCDWFEEKDLRGFRRFLGRYGYCKGPVVESIPVEQGQVVFSERLSVPVNPVVGTIGVAPDSGPIPAGRRGTYGGNMDCRIIGEGATVFLPVYVEGALLSVGDVHAAQSDGEVLRPPEARADVTLLTDVRKGLGLKGPFVDTDEHLHAIGSGEDLETALELAMTGMIDFLARRLPLTLEDIAYLIGTYVDTSICQITGSEQTLRVSLQKHVIPEPMLRSLIP